ncbi:succinate dehydrogenase/fumarate reductase flavoprotein subunit [Paenarthrobacter nicotinovorans]|uniref:FAD-dependent oxidoreductase n=1 Tax=Micrococcaceae TaxID=1268 RepID=UPI0008763AB1|nr:MULTISPECIES: FAD-dependent oxidoreductase [Micrococcaceae]MDR6436728.1 succinate dehydrogenase/fumarate reductase flavoprotein subunit [Paenarthrobacter nicotinovorans]SCZ56780.1 Succinate dehydrogenase/fumarate reductase, flavoprotein subunit [Arthrobacter sp. UNCCL28]
MKTTKTNETSTTPRTTLDCDVLVIGSGAGGLSAAVTAAYHGLKVIVVEKADVCGGATSWSGGWAWTPGNPLAKAAGIHEDRELFRTYLRHRLGRNYNPERIEAFLEAVPHMVGFFHNKTSLQFVPGAKIKDIYGQTPGAGSGNRSVGPKPFNARNIKPELRAKARHQLYETSFLGMGIMAGPDLTKFLSASQGNIGGLLHATWRVGLHILDLIVHRRNMQLVNGTALTARLLKSADDLGVDIRVSTPAERLLTDETGKVSGAVVHSPDGSRTINASRGVVLATGGFPKDVARRAQLFPNTPTGEEHWTLAPKETTGDGITMAQAIGARFDTDLESPAAWCPVSLVPYRNGRTGTFPHIMDRAKPGSIGVLRNGQRFVNEANGYYDYVEGMLHATPEGEPVEAWQIADAEYVRKFPLGMAKPLPVPLFPYLRSGYLKKGDTIEELATACGIVPHALAQTVARFNDNARKGIDPEFNRGATEFNRYGGDPKQSPNPSLRPLEKGPFYAVKVLPGSFGTFAGLATDPRARALDSTGQPINGLYVAGNDQASVMGGHYPAGGINLGPALTFGYIAGRDLAGVTGYEDDGEPVLEYSRGSQQ